LAAEETKKGDFALVFFDGASAEGERLFNDFVG